MSVIELHRRSAGTDAACLCGLGPVVEVSGVRCSLHSKFKLEQNLAIENVPTWPRALANNHE